MHLFLRFIFYVLLNEVWVIFYHNRGSIVRDFRCCWEMCADGRRIITNYRSENEYYPSFNLELQDMLSTDSIKILCGSW